ncbi:MAG: metallophosphoesterase family protein [Chloroflexi bacterium]|nr:metallophosphoesterase family protein [Chloroflexota bacterium]
MSDAYLPSGFPANRLAARIGLISDTHLPEQQLVSVAGRRILLWHSHDPHRATELRLREADSWAVLLGRIRERARRAGATLAVFGHIHVPLQQEEDGLLLVNPGALAPGNHYLRQRLQSVALLFVRDDGATAVRHVDLNDPEQVYTIPPRIDWQASFSTAHNAISETILGPGLARLLSALRNVDFAEPETVKAAYRRLAHRCWAGELALITAADLLAEIAADPDVPYADRQKINQLAGAL